jgi:hypothetical protein
MTADDSKGQKLILEGSKLILEGGSRHSSWKDEDAAAMVLEGAKVGRGLKSKVIQGRHARQHTFRVVRRYTVEFVTVHTVAVIRHE